jgi:uncharacterized phage protein (TIGR01671 family)
MREIKFRLWSKEREVMVYPDRLNYFDKSYKGENGYWQTAQLSTLIRLNGEKVNLMQYTGLKDRNGKEIYEGDIVKKFNQTGGVRYEQGVYFVDWREANYKSYLSDVNYDGEVIGNIFEGESK